MDGYEREEETMRTASFECYCLEEEGVGGREEKEGREGRREGGEEMVGRTGMARGNSVVLTLNFLGRVLRYLQRPVPVVLRRCALVPQLSDGKKTQ